MKLILLQTNEALNAAEKLSNPNIALGALLVCLIAAVTFLARQIVIDRKSYREEISQERQRAEKQSEKIFEIATQINHNHQQLNGLLERNKEKDREILQIVSSLNSNVRELGAVFKAVMKLNND